MALQLGNTGDKVRQLQNALSSLRYEVGKIDGHYGIRTSRAVAQFQLDYGLEPDGVFGPVTKAKMKEAVVGKATKVAITSRPIAKVTGGILSRKYYGLNITYWLAISGMLIAALVYTGRRK